MSSPVPDRPPHRWIALLVWLVVLVAGVLVIKNARFSADLSAFLAYQPVRARHVTPAGRLLRWVRRERLKASLALVLAVSIPAVLGTWLYLEESRPYIALGQATERGARVDQLLGRPLSPAALLAEINRIK